MYPNLMKQFGWKRGVYKAPAGYEHKWLVVMDDETIGCWSRSEARAAWNERRGHTIHVDQYRTTYHRNGTVTVWDVFQQVWTRTRRPSDAVLASMDAPERNRIMRHCGIEVAP